MEVFKRSQFIVRHDLEDIKDADVIMDTDMNPLCYIKRQQSWKGLEMPSWLAKIPVLNMLFKVLSRNRLMRTTDMQFEGADGLLLAKIYETPVVQGIREIRKWRIYSSEEDYKGAVKEKFKAIGSDWVLENTGGKVLAASEGDRGKHDYEVIAPDKQVIAQCHPEETAADDSYKVDILKADFDPFLVMSYILVLAHASAWKVEKQRRNGF